MESKFQIQETLAACQKSSGPSFKFDNSCGRLRGRKPGMNLWIRGSAFNFENTYIHPRSGKTWKKIEKFK